MVDKYTENDVMHLNDGYSIEIELANGRSARISGKSVKVLLQSANDLYKRSQRHHKQDEDCETSPTNN